MIYDHVVIGAGISGMTAALTLSKNGFRVALVEGSKKIGPILRGFYRDGVYFDTGFHYTGGLQNGAILNTFFRYLGIDSHVVKKPFRENGFDVFRCPRSGFEFSFPYGFERIEARLCDVFPDENEAVSTYLSTISRNCESRPYLNLDAEIVPFQAMKSIHGQSLQTFLDHLTENRLLKQVLSTHCFLHGVPPFEAPLQNHSAIVGPYYRSVHGLEGGGRSLVKAMGAALKKAGTDVFCGHRVTEIQFSDPGELESVRLDNGRSLSCRACISTIHPKSLLDLVPEALLRPVYRKRIQHLEETPSAHILFGVCDEPLELLSGRNLFLLPDPTAAGLGEDEPFARRPVFISALNYNGSGKSHSFIAICPARIEQLDPWKASKSGSRSPDYTRFKQDIGVELQHLIETGCPELKGKVTYVDHSTPLTIRDFTNTPFGSMYGVKHKIDQYNPMPVTRLHNLFLAGQAVVAPGVLGGMISGFLVCGNILGHERLREEFRKWK